MTLAVPGAASAATICVGVSSASCDSTSPDVQAALDAAEATAAADRVVLGAGVFNGPFVYAAGANGGGLELVGQGPDTVISDSLAAPADNLTMLDLRRDGAGNDANVSSLAVQVPANATAGNPGNVGIEADGTISRVEVTSDTVDPGGNGAVGILITSSGVVVRNSEIRMSGAGNFGTGVSLRTAAALAVVPQISDSRIVARKGVEAGGSPVNITRSRIVSGSTGIDVCASPGVSVDNTVFRLAAGTAIDVNAGRCGGTNSVFAGKHLTIVGPGTSAATGVRVSANNQAPGAPRSATLSHSIIRDVQTALEARTSDPASTATATISIGASDFESGRVTVVSGGGGLASVAQPQTNIDADPLFADPLFGDYSLLAGSPAVDASFSPPLDAAESATDLAGNPRITDGDGDGVSERDMGAFERPAVPPDEPPADPPDPDDTDPPETTITKDPPRRTDAEKVKFKFVSDEEGSTFECKFDKKAFKPCSSPKKIRVDEGKHKFKVRAIDAAGNVDPTPDKDKFKIVG